LTPNTTGSREQVSGFYAGPAGKLSYLGRTGYLRDCGQQIARVRRARLTQDLLGPTAFDKLADAHDRDPRG